MNRLRVVVTGMGAVSAAGIGARALWDAVRAGRPLGNTVTKFDVSQYKSKIAACVPDFDLADHGFSPEQVEKWDRTTLFGMVAAQEALDQAGIEGLDPVRCGSCVGTAIGGVGYMESRFYSIVEQEPDLDGAPPYVRLRETGGPTDWLSAYMCSATSLEIAAKWNLRGPVTCVATGCTAGVDAIGYSAEAIRRGEADFMVTGGTDAPITPICLTAFDLIDAVSRRNHQPDKASRPFDKNRDGFLLGEGAGIIVLEGYEHAVRRGAQILGEVTGFGTNCNAFHMTGIEADGAMLARSMELALADSELEPSRIDYINAHGSSTRQNDRAETAAYKRVFSEYAYEMPISSTKSITGHALGAASALEMIVCIESMRESWVHPTANLEEPSLDCDLDYVPAKGRPWKLRYVISNASGFSGLHSAVILEEVATQ